MRNRGGPLPRKGPRWIVDQIAAAFASSRGERVRVPQNPGRVDVDGLVDQALEEELGRLESPPCPSSQTGEGTGGGE